MARSDGRPLASRRDALGGVHCSRRCRPHSRAQPPANSSQASGLNVEDVECTCQDVGVSVWRRDVGVSVWRNAPARMWVSPSGGRRDVGVSVWRLRLARGGPAPVPSIRGSHRASTGRDPVPGVRMRSRLALWRSFVDAPWVSGIGGSGFSMGQHCRRRACRRSGDTASRRRRRDGPRWRACRDS